MWEDGGPVDVAVAVDGVDAVEHGDPEERRERAPLHLVHHRHPRLRRRVRRRDAAPAAQHASCSHTVQSISPTGFKDDERTVQAIRTYEVLPDDGGGGVLPLDLRHLPDLLGQGHPRQQVADPPVERLLRVLVLGVVLRRRRRHENAGAT